MPILAVLALSGGVLTLAATQTAPQQPSSPRQPAGIVVPPRDAAPAKEGTASIRGRVTAADSGLPLRRAIVTLTGASGTLGSSASRSVATDLDGRFAFTRLAAGDYRFRVSPGSYRGAYLAVAYGARRSSDAGQVIELKEGQRVQADVALPRGGAITGRVIDEFGEPVTRANVYPSRVMPGGSSFQRTGGGVNTDDLGRFRVYGLEAGEYIVVAEVRGMGGGPPVDGASEGFVPTYFPSTFNEREAGRVRVPIAGNVGELEIQLIRTRTFQITGMVVDSQGRAVLRPNAMLVRPIGASGWSSFGVNTDSAGKFTIRDVIPGEYRFVVRPGSMGPPQEQTPAQERREYASILLSVSADIDDVLVVTQPGISIAGQVVFADGTPSDPPGGLRVMLQPAERAMPGPSPSTAVGSNLEFTLNDVFGTHLVRMSGLPAGYALKAVMLGMTDITDTPAEFTPEHSKHLQLVVTSRASTLEGIVTDDSGQPATSATILIIPEDKQSWKLNSPRMYVTGILKAGKFSITRVLPGRYYVIAVSRDRFSLTPDAGAELFEPLIREATMVTVGEYEKRTLDLRIAKDSQER